MHWICLVMLQIFSLEQLQLDIWKQALNSLIAPSTAATIQLCPNLQKRLLRLLVITTPLEAPFQTYPHRPHLIVDWSGSKLFKSLYLKRDAYRGRAVDSGTIPLVRPYSVHYMHMLFTRQEDLKLSAIHMLRDRVNREWQICCGGVERHPFDISILLILATS